MATAGMAAGISTVMWSSPITTQAPERGLSPSMTHLQSIPHRPPTQLPLGQGINIFLHFFLDRSKTKFTSVTLFIFLAQFLVATKIFGRDQFFASILVATKISRQILGATKISRRILVTTKISFSILVATKISFSIFVATKISFSILVATKMLFWLG